MLPCSLHSHSHSASGCFIFCLLSRLAMQRGAKLAVQTAVRPHIARELLSPTCRPASHRACTTSSHSSPVASERSPHVVAFLFPLSVSSSSCPCSYPACVMV